MSQHPAKLLLTLHAVQNFRDIETYSREHWSDSVAETYLDELEAGLSRIAKNPELLQPLPEIPASLKFYRVNKHLLVCDVRDRSVVVLTVMHTSMDIPARLAELQPILALEIEMLHRQLHS